MPRCQGCGAIIDWVKTHNGVSMPVNPGYVEIDPNGPKITTVVTDDGRVCAGGKVDTLSLFPVATIKGRISHYATCPKSREFRRDR